MWFCSTIYTRFLRYIFFNLASCFAVLLNCYSLLRIWTKRGYKYTFISLQGEQNDIIYCSLVTSKSKNKKSKQESKSKNIQDKAWNFLDDLSTTWPRDLRLDVHSKVGELLCLRPFWQDPQTHNNIVLVINLC